jgi:dephospho-CoA kinase
MFTESEDMPLGQVLAKVRDHEGSKKASVNWRKASAKELTEYFATVLPDYDRDRVHNSDIKKLLQWYDILIDNGITEFEKDLAPTDGDNVDDRQEEE